MQDPCNCKLSWASFLFELIVTFAYCKLDLQTIGESKCELQQRLADNRSRCAIVISHRRWKSDEGNRLVLYFYNHVDVWSTSPTNHYTAFFLIIFSDLSNWPDVFELLFILSSYFVTTIAKVCCMRAFAMAFIEMRIKWNYYIAFSMPWIYSHFSAFKWMSAFYRKQIFLFD